MHRKDVVIRWLCECVSGSHLPAPPTCLPQIPALLGAGLNVRLQTTVTAISTSATGAAVTYTTTPGGPPVTLTAQAVICTIPLGVLKSGSVSFSPALPATHANAIARLGMGTLDKLVLSFPTVFWDASVDWLERIPAAPYGTPGYGQWVDWASMARCCGHSILVGFNSAAQALALEAQTDEAILASGMAVLRGIYGAGIPDPTAYVVTRWAADPFARGSYSYYRLGSSPTDRTNLQAPVGGRLFFSGEHVSPAYFGTVAGAFLDGQRAASAVADSPFFSTTNAATTPSHTLEL